MKDRIFETFKIPPDMARGVSLIEISGHKVVKIENFKSLLCYESEKICVLAKGYSILIKGTELNIEYYSELIMRITGNISSICFDRRD